MLVEIELTDLEIKVIEHDYKDVTTFTQKLIDIKIKQLSSQLADKTVRSLNYEVDEVLLNLFNTEGYKNAATVEAESITNAEARGE